MKQIWNFGSLGLNTAKFTDYIKKLFKEKLRIKFCTKKSGGVHVYLPQEWSQGARKIDMYQIIYCTEMGKQFHFLARRCQNYQLYQKTLQIKVPINALHNHRVFSLFFACTLMCAFHVTLSSRMTYRYLTFFDRFN